MVATGNDIKEWVEIHTDALYQWACYKLSDEELAKDMVQDTFTTAFEKIEHFGGKSNPKTWLFSILNHKIIDHYRKQFRNPVERGVSKENNFFDDDGMWRNEMRPQHWDYDLNLLDNLEFRKILDGCMGKLPQQWASAIQMKYLSEKDGNEVCKELNLSTTNYWQIIHRAKLNLRQCLEFNWFK